MTIAKQTSPFVCSRCLYRQSRILTPLLRNGQYLRHSTQAAPLPHDNERPKTHKGDEPGSSENTQEQVEEPGRMSRRLAQMTEESIEQGPRGAKKAIEEGGFSEGLKKQLETRIQDSTFKSENPAAFAQLNMPVGLKPL